MSFFEYRLGDNRYSFEFDIGVFVFEEIENSFVNSLLQRESLTAAAADMPLFLDLPFSLELSMPCDNGGGYYYNNVFQSVSDSCTDCNFFYSRNHFFDSEKQLKKGERTVYGEYVSKALIGLPLSGEKGFDACSALDNRYENGGFSEAISGCIKSDISGRIADSRLDLIMRETNGRFTKFSQAYEDLPYTPFYGFCGDNKRGCADKTEKKVCSFDINAFQNEEKKAFLEKISDRLFLRNLSVFYGDLNYFDNFKSGFGVELNGFFAADNPLVGAEKEILGKQDLLFWNRDFAFGNLGIIYQQGKEDLGALAYGAERLAFSKRNFYVTRFSVSQEEGRRSEAFGCTEPSRTFQGASVLWEKSAIKGFERLEGLLSVSAPNIPFTDERDWRGADIGKLFLWENELHISPEDVKKIRNASMPDYFGEHVKAEIRVDMSGMKNIFNRETDIDCIVADLTAAVSEAVASAAEGVHSL